MLKRGVSREDVGQGWEVRSLLLFFFFFLFFFDGGWSGGAERRFTPETSLPPRAGETKGAFSLRSTVTWEAAVNVGHVSGLLLLLPPLLHLSASPPQLWCLCKPPEL